MKTVAISIFYILIASLVSKAQEIDSLKNINKPLENISVHKQYDENGNLIQYDSVYTYTYSNISGDTAELNSIIGSFPGFFNNNFDNFTLPDFNQADSLFFNNFFNINSFQEGFFNQDKDFLELFQKMDSIKYEQFEEQNYSSKDI